MKCFEKLVQSHIILFYVCPLHWTHTNLPTEHIYRVHYCYNSPHCSCPSWHIWDFPLDLGFPVGSLPKGESWPRHRCRSQPQHWLLTVLCAESLLYTFYTQNCTPAHSSKTILKFAQTQQSLDLSLMGMSTPIGMR